MGGEKSLAKKVLKNSLAKKIVKGIAIPVIVIFIIAGAWALKTVDNAVTSLSESTLAAESQAAAYQVSDFFTKYLEIATQLASNSALENLLESTKEGEVFTEVQEFPETKKSLDKSRATDADNVLATWVSDFDSSQLYMSDGFLSEPGWDVTARPWYQVSVVKSVLLTAPYVDVSTKKLIVSAAAPIYDQESGNIIGAAGIDMALDHLETIMKSYKLGKNGFYILVAADDQIVYHTNSDLIQQKITDIGVSEKVLSDLKNQVYSFQKYKVNGNSFYGSLIPVGNTGWHILSGLPAREFDQTFTTLMISIIAIFLLGIAVIFGFIRLISRAMSKPLKNLTEKAEQIANGNLDVLVDIDTGDEIGEVGVAITHTVERLKEYMNYINEIESVLNQIAEGNLKFELQYNYAGDFSKLKLGVLHVQSKLTSTISDINEVAGQVAEGASQIAQVAHSLAESSTEQANYIEKLNHSITDLSHITLDNTENAKKANDSSTMASAALADGNHKMIELTKTITEIHTTSGQIKNIMQTIDEIASQTNLLALNASIEAARAGESGRGFAVVANEVGTLASQSTEASGETAKLITDILGSIENGTNMTKDTAKAISDIMQTELDSASRIKQIADAALVSEEAIQVISSETELIMGAVESNTAASQESVAASEELAAQADKLRKLVNTFKM